MSVKVRRSESLHWSPQPEAAAIIDALAAEFRDALPWLDRLGERMRSETGTRLVDWIDSIRLRDDRSLARRLADAGFTSLDVIGGSIWRHPGGDFPRIELKSDGRRAVFLQVESVADFLLIHGLAGDVPVSGDPLADVRLARTAVSETSECWIVERHGSRSPAPEDVTPQQAQAVLYHGEAFLLRKRHFPDIAAGFDHASNLIAAAGAELGVSRACDLFFAAERAYWESRNRAARVQRSRQDFLGLGWANHDHHTYRSSRAHFRRLIQVLEQMGFECRERFYAGDTAGWGAQILEQSDCGIIVFADVDLSPEEVSGDFAHLPLPSRDTLGTVGLWCRLHGEAFLEAGMHHLECRFDFNAARDQLEAAGVSSMPPFTDLPYLRQAFTHGEIWPVAGWRIELLVRGGLITEEDADRFREEGAIGSHLEILQRDQGYKGFNQSGIDEIIRGTDPRTAGT